jgi:insertion element IS1 protein InsB
LKRSKKAPPLRHIKALAIQQMEPDEIIMKIQKVEAAAGDEMWSVVEKNTPQRWLWHAIDHRTGLVVAYVVGNHQDDGF